MNMKRTVVDPVRLIALLTARVLRRTSLVAARGSRRWETALQNALEAPVLQWAGPWAVVAEPLQPQAPRGPLAHVGLTDDELAAWAALPFPAASARAASLDTPDLRHLLDYERCHGHRVRFERLLENQVELLERRTG
jgi:hypothetical protein